jgi:hypothetical protein
LGDATVTVAGGTTSLTTKTITSGSLAGTYIVSGLPTPGNYTVTISAPGHATQTVPIALGSSGLAQGVNATLPSTLAKISGTVAGSDAPGGLANATITVTDGLTTRTATSATVPTGFYSVVALNPGSYTVTMSAAGYKSKTTLITIAPGVDQILNVTLDKAT